MENPQQAELAGHSPPGGADRAVTVYWANNPQTKTDLLYMADRNSSKETITVSRCLKFTFLGEKKRAKIWLYEIRCVVVPSCDRQKPVQTHRCGFFPSVYK